MDINKSDCGFTYYRYYIKGIHSGAGNYIPIFAINIPHTYASVRTVQINIRGLAPSDFGVENNAEAFWKYVPKGGIPTSFLEIYKDDFFTISTPNTTDLSCAFKDSNGNNLGRTRTSGVYNVSENVIPIFGVVVITSDNEVIYGGGSLAGSDYDFLYCYAIQGNDTIDIIHKPISEKSKGIAVYPPLNVSVDARYNTTSFKKRIHELLKISRIIDTKDPNPGGGDSKPGGGGGDGDIGGDTNPDDGLPTISALDSGLLTAYNPNVGQLQSLGRFLWSDSFNLDSFKKLFNDPFDTLLGLSVVPVKPNTSRTQTIMFGNMDSGVSAPVVSNQWVSKDMGSVALNEVWKGALDYAPSTSVTIYLPFIGMRQLNVNDVMGSSLHLIYKFDVLTGSCIAQIYVNHNHQGNKNGGFSWTKNQGLLYEFIGQCAENIPLASQDFTNTIRAAIGGVAVATGAAASIATGNPALGIAGLTVGAANLGMQASTPTVERGGHLSGSASILGYSQPFLIVERPHQCKPSKYYALRGVPSQVYTSKLSNCTNFTQITANNNLHIAGASDSELTELQNLLVAGVYFPNKKR